MCAVRLFSYYTQIIDSVCYLIFCGGVRLNTVHAPPHIRVFVCVWAHILFHLQLCRWRTLPLFSQWFIFLLPPYFNPLYAYTSQLIALSSQSSCANLGMHAIVNNMQKSAIWKIFIEWGAVMVNIYWIILMVFSMKRAGMARRPVLLTHTFFFFSSNHIYTIWIMNALPCM